MFLCHGSSGSVEFRLIFRKPKVHILSWIPDISANIFISLQSLHIKFTPSHRELQSTQNTFQANNMMANNWKTYLYLHLCNTLTQGLAHTQVANSKTFAAARLRNKNLKQVMMMFFFNRCLRRLLHIGIRSHRMSHLKTCTVTKATLGYHNCITIL